MSKEEHYRKLEHMYLSAPVNEYYGPEIHISEGRVRVTIPVRPDFFHAADAVHGAVYFKLLDDSDEFDRIRSYRYRILQSIVQVGGNRGIARHQATDHQKEQKDYCRNRDEGNCAEAGLAAFLCLAISRRRRWGRRWHVDLAR